MNVLKRKLPLGAVAFLLVLALAAIGLVYGNWSQTLSISGTVETGSISAQWNDLISPTGTCIDNEATSGPKNVAETTFLVKPGGKVANITITNGYPNYVGDCEVEYEYTGKIPGVYVSHDFIPGSGLTGCQETTPANALPGSWTETCNELEVEFRDGLCDTLFNTQKPAGSLFVRVLKGAAQWNDTANYPPGGYTFDVELNLVPWNKAECDG